MYGLGISSPKECVKMAERQRQRELFVKLKSLLHNAENKKENWTFFVNEFHYYFYIEEILEINTAFEKCFETRIGISDYIGHVLDIIYERLKEHDFLRPDKYIIKNTELLKNYFEKVNDNATLLIKGIFVLFSTDEFKEFVENYKKS